MLDYHKLFLHYNDCTHFPRVYFLYAYFQHVRGLKYVLHIEIKKLSGNIKSFLAHAENLKTKKITQKPSRTIIVNFMKYIVLFESIGIVNDVTKDIYVEIEFKQDNVDNVIISFLI